jgi:hypothetical protein
MSDLGKNDVVDQAQSAGDLEQLWMPADALDRALRASDDDATSLVAQMAGWVRSAAESGTAEDVSEHRRFWTRFAPEVTAWYAERDRIRRQS